MSTKDKFYFIYILTNKGNTVLYTGITNDIERRVFEHKEKSIKGFTEKYSVNKLVYYEIYEEVHMALAREKQIKGGSRKDKINLVNRKNKEWRDLAEDFK